MSDFHDGLAAYLAALETFPDRMAAYLAAREALMPAALIELSEVTRATWPTAVQVQIEPSDQPYGIPSVTAVILADGASVQFGDPGSTSEDDQRWDTYQDDSYEPVWAMNVHDPELVEDDHGRGHTAIIDLTKEGQ